jgi:hypothetical protein
MRVSFVRRGLLLALAVSAAACTSSTTTTPTAPTVTTLLTSATPKVGGLFQGQMTLSTVGTGSGTLPDAGVLDCIGNQYKQLVGTQTNVDLVLTQDTLNVSTITARLTSTSTGLACTYEGAIGTNNSLILDADPGATRCTEAHDQALFCPLPDGTTAALGMSFLGSSMRGSFDGWPANVSAVHGNLVTNYNLYTGDHKYYGALIVNHDLSLTKQ